MNTTTVSHDGSTVTIERVISASKDKVWDAYSVADIFAQWFAPAGWSCEVRHLDFQPGGYLQYAMKCEDPAQTEWYGKESCGKTVYEAIDPKDSFRYKDYFTDSDGSVLEGMPVPEIVNSFEEVDGGTKITSVSTYETEADVEKVLAMGMEEGIKQTFDKLASVLET